MKKGLLTQCVFITDLPCKTGGLGGCEDEQALQDLDQHTDPDQGRATVFKYLFCLVSNKLL